MEINNDIDAELRQLMLSDEEEDDLRQAFLRIDNPLPDVGGEWDKVSRGIHKGHRAAIYVLGGLAAAACIVLAFLLVPRLMAPIDKYADNGLRRGVERTGSYQQQLSTTSVGKPSRSVARQVAMEDIEMLTVETTRGHDQNITLPDGSRVWLNADSRLMYPSRFAGSKREVYIHGEGYFEVRHDAKHPFIVSTDYFTTTVLGTVFNINAYNRKDANVVLVSGKVSVSSGDPSIQYVIKPEQKAVCDNGGVWSVTHVNTYPYTQRKAGYFYFDQQPLHDIMAEIGRWYGRTVVFENVSLANQCLHFVAERHDKLENVIASLNRMDGLNIALERNEIVVR